MVVEDEAEEGLVEGKEGLARVETLSAVMEIHATGHCVLLHYLNNISHTPLSSELFHQGVHPAN